MVQKALDAVKVLGKSKGSIATATTTALDFGTPNDVNLAVTNWAAGCRLLLVVALTTTGTTDTTNITVQDAPDSSGSIGTPATALTTVLPDSPDDLAGGTGDQYIVVEITPQADRPWIRVNLHRGSGTTDTTAGVAVLLALPYAI